MDAKRAAEVLRGDNDPSATDLAVAAKLGAQALEALAWVERHKAQVFYQYGDWLCVVDGIVRGKNTTPLAAVLDAMEKEKGDG